MTFGHWTSGIQESTSMDMNMDAHSFRNRRGNRKTGTGRQEQEQERRQENRNRITGTGTATMDAHPSATRLQEQDYRNRRGDRTRPAHNRSALHALQRATSCYVGPQEKKTSNRGMGAALQTPIDMPSVCFSAFVPTSRPERGSWTEGACS
ncbi:MAG: hypothetical protein J3R72DRAFT_436560 [Linnemannia gamsii]|nr:MAG: hypothetical protein J3R72DRAFT_436560 [Linnemannia gamsii]